MSKNQNAFETTLTAQFGPSDLVAHVATLGTLTSPCYMVLEPTNDAQREVVYFDGIFGASSFVTTGTDNRYLPGSAASSGLTHPAGVTIRSVILAQHLEDLYAYVDSLDHGALIGLASGDDHPQYVLETDHETAGSHDAMAINAGRLQGLYAVDFAPPTVIVQSGITGSLTNATDSYQTAFSVPIDIPAAWNTYDLLVTYHQPISSGGAASLYTKISVDSVDGALELSQSQVQGLANHLAEVFVGETSVGAVYIAGRYRSENGVTTPMLKATVTIVATRKS